MRFLLYFENTAMKRRKIVYSIMRFSPRSGEKFFRVKIRDFGRIISDLVNSLKNTDLDVCRREFYVSDIFTLL